MFDAVVRRGSIVSAQETRPGDIAIKDGKIVAVLAPGTPVVAEHEYDATGCYVLPGAVDVHVHSRAPARPDRETWESATQAAARGGITTIVEMPTSDPAASTPAVLRNRVRTALQSAHVDFALYAGGVTGSARAAAELAAEGIVGFKILSHSPPPNREREFVGLCAVSNAQLYESLQAIAGTGLPCAVHAEDESLLEQGVERTRAGGTGHPLEHARSRPPYVEAVSIATLLILTEETGARLHLPHVSSAWGLRLALEGKSKGVDVSVETCPHYLCFDESKLAELGGFAKVNPPLRLAADREALWEGIRTGGVDNVASDHGPYLYEEKDKESIWEAQAGNPGLEAVASVVYDAAVRGGITFNQAAAVLAENPAERFGLSRKGRLAPGFDADLVIFDPDQKWTFDWRDAYSLVRRNYKMYQGREFHGKLRAVLSRGTLVYDGRKVVGSAGHGRYVTPGD